MAFYHRKLLDEPVVDAKLADKCKAFCDGIKNQRGICSSECLNFCSTSCKKDDFDDDYDSPDKSSKAHLLLAICLSIIIISSFVFAFYVFYKFCLTRYRSRRGRLAQEPQPEEDEESGPYDSLDVDQTPEMDHPIWYIRTVGLQPSVINEIAIVKYKKSGGLVEGTDCSVCLSEFEEDEMLRLLPKCNHAFHIPCIDTWLQSHTNCPMCRAAIVNNPSTPALPSQELIVRNSRLMEETRQARVSERSREMGRESETQDPELSRNLGENVRNSDLDGIQPMRRSASMDSLSATMISDALVNSELNSRHDLVGVKEVNVGIDGNRDVVNQRLLKLVQSSISTRSLHMGSSCITRSLSCSAKVLLSRYSTKHKNSLVPRRS